MSRYFRMLIKSRAVTEEGQPRAITVHLSLFSFFARMEREKKKIFGRRDEKKKRKMRNQKKWGEGEKKRKETFLTQKTHEIKRKLSKQAQVDTHRHKIMDRKERKEKGKR